MDIEEMFGIMDRKEIIERNIDIFRGEEFKRALHDPDKASQGVPEGWYKKGVGHVNVVPLVIDEKGKVLHIVTRGYDFPPLNRLSEYGVKVSVGQPMRKGSFPERLRFRFSNRNREHYLLIDQSTSALDFVPETARETLNLSELRFNELYGFVWSWEQKG